MRGTEEEELGGGGLRREQTDQLRKMSSRGIHFDLKEGHLEGHIALNKAYLQKKKKRRSQFFFAHPRYTLLGIISENPI